MVHKARGVAKPSRREAQLLARERFGVAQAVGVEPFVRRGSHEAGVLNYERADRDGLDRENAVAAGRFQIDDLDGLSSRHGWPVCVQENPKKPGTACNLRYEAYKSATTVAEFLEKGGTPADLTHDVGKGFVWYLDADDSQDEAPSSDDEDDAPWHTLPEAVRMRAELAARLADLDDPFIGHEDFIQL